MISSSIQQNDNQQHYFVPRTGEDGHREDEDRAYGEQDNLDGDHQHGVDSLSQSHQYNANFLSQS